MRYALALIAMLVPAGVMADSSEPPLVKKQAIAAIVSAQYVDRKCPAYRTNIAALSEIAATSGLTSDEMSGPFGSYTEIVRDGAEAHKGLSDQQFCDYLFDFYQATDTKSHIIERR